MLTASCLLITWNGHASAAWKGRYFVDISLPFSMKWEASAVQDTTSIMAQHLNRQESSVLNYVDDFESGGFLTSGYSGPFWAFAGPLGHTGPR